MTDTSTRSTRRPVKAAGKRKTANRFAKFAGGDADTETNLSPAPADEPTPEASGLIGGMSAVAADEAHRVVNLAVAEIAPHPFNDDARSQPQPGDAKWEELLNGVRTNGVRLPVLVVPRDSFAAARPTAAQHISPEAKYVLVYGHRRRAAALEAGRDTVPAVVDDSIMAEDGDLDAMATENLGRQDLSELAEADLFARYSEIGLSQRAIAERLGVDQATVSRRLALLLLAHEVRTAVEAGDLKVTEAAHFANLLPYGPPRRWQKTKDPEQDTDQRRGEQIAALRFVVEKDWTGKSAAERVNAERVARGEAEALGVAIVEDPEAELGPSFYDHRISRDALNDPADAFGVINPHTGQLDLYRRTAPQPAAAEPAPIATETGDAQPAPPAADRATDPATVPDDDAAAGEQDTSGEDAGADAEAAALAEQKSADAAAAKAAQARRRDACAGLINHPPSNADLLKVLVRQCLSGVSARSQTSAVKALLKDWDASVDGTGEKARNTRAWHLAVASAELHTAELKGAWDDDAITHLEMLTERVGYQPTEWENRRLTEAGGR